MSTTTFDPSCYDFDLNFLRQPNGDVTIPIEKYEKQKKSIMFIKKKIIVTENLIQKYTANKEQLDQTEKMLFNSQEENKSVLIEYKNLLDKCSKLELDIQALLNLKQDLEAKYTSAENRCEAIRAHSKQLEHLIKEYEARIETLKFESLDEKGKAKKFEKRYSSYQKEYDIMKQHMNIVLGAVHRKKMLKMNRKDRLIVEKYLSHFNKKFKESLFDGDSEEETETFDSLEDPITEDYPTKNNEEILTTIQEQKRFSQRPCLIKTDDIDRDTGCSQIMSPDTGRGSSLAFSDSEKMSPDYTNDSVFTEIVSSTRNYVNMTTSPIPRIIMVDNSTSPIHFDKNTSEYVDQAVIPLKLGKHAATSPIRNIKHKLCKECEKECLELNKSNMCLENSSEDCEVATILDQMRLPRRLVTPLPRTPASCAAYTRDCQCCSCRNKIEIKEELARFCEQILARTQDTQKLQTLLAEPVMINNQSLRRASEEDHRNTEHDSEILTCDSPEYSDDLEEVDDPIRIDHPSNFNQPIQPTVDTREFLTDDVINELSINNHHDYTTNINKDLENEISNTIIVNENESMPNTQSKLQFEEDSVEKSSPKERKKLTKLEKFKKRMLPRCKIQRDSKPLKKSNIKLRLLPTRSAKKSSLGQNSMTLNDKKAYENAVKVMKELNAKKILKDHENLIKVSKKQYDNKNVVRENTTEKENKRQLRSHNNKTFDDAQSKVQSNDESKMNSDENMEQKINNPEINSEKQNNAAKEISPLEINSEKPIEKENNHNKHTKILSSTELRKVSDSVTDNTDSSDKQVEGTRRNKRMSTENIELNNNKRILRSSMNNNLQEKNFLNSERTQVNKESSECTRILIRENRCSQEKSIFTPDKSVLCMMIEKYGTAGYKYPKKIPDSTVEAVFKDIDENINRITEMSATDAKEGMNKFAEDLQRFNLHQFTAGLMKFLAADERKNELFNKTKIPSGPAMTKTEQILLYVVLKLKDFWSEEDVINYILKNIEYTLFRLNRTPDFNTIESMSHFYAVICRYIKAKCRLRIFILDAMYTMNFKAIPLIKHCLDVWMHILPLAHMSIAKTPLVTCLVYLLHYFKCEDKFNRVQEIRRMLHQMYFYKITEWTEPKILEFLKQSIKDIRGNATECKMLRLAIIILAKRHGPQWCQKHIIKNMLQPIIEDQHTLEAVKVFCISLVGPLIKPYPLEMKVHCEILINQLIDMVELNPSPKLQEAIYTSLIFAAKHNQNKVIQMLLSWNLREISPDIEAVLKDYVREKSLRSWKNVLSKIALNR